MEVFQGKTVLVVKAPPDTRLEVPDPSMVRPRTVLCMVKPCFYNHIHKLGHASWLDCDPEASEMSMLEWCCIEVIHCLCLTLICVAVCCKVAQSVKYDLPVRLSLDITVKLAYDGHFIRQLFL